MGAYWRALSDAGITRERLESFDRAIKTDPVFWPEKKDALLREFRNYLTILQVRRVGEEEWGVGVGGMMSVERAPVRCSHFFASRFTHVRAPPPPHLSPRTHAHAHHHHR